MSFIVGILTFFLVVNCALLILLILIQLPKKDAGAGMAFGGAAADALFGAGSGNVLTKVTKWATVVFFGLALVLGYLQNQVHNQGNVLEFEKQVQQKQMQMPISAPRPVTPPVSQPAAAPTNNLLSLPLSAPNNAPVAPTNTPAAPTQSK
ncbi:MAG: preprotein translocase subunit SecG [Verrucomicrobiota bacterium]|jgi:preprotein translocase subunit SecG